MIRHIDGKTSKNVIENGSVVNDIKRDFSDFSEKTGEVFGSNPKQELKKEQTTDEQTEVFINEVTSKEKEQIIEIDDDFSIDDIFTDLKGDYVETIRVPLIAQSIHLELKMPVKGDLFNLVENDGSIETKKFKFIYDLIINKKKFNNSFEEFIKYVSVTDADLCIYHIVKGWDEKITEFCTAKSCGKRIDFDKSISDIRKLSPELKAWEDFCLASGSTKLPLCENPITKEEIVEFSKNVSFKISSPSLENFLRLQRYSGDISPITLYEVSNISSMIATTSNGKKVSLNASDSKVLKGIVEMLERSTSSELSTKIDKIHERLTQTFKFDYTCPHCGEVHKNVEIDPLDSLLGKVFG